MEMFLGSPHARVAYVKHLLVPFLRKYSAEDAKIMLQSPPQEIVDATCQFVKAMATNASLGEAGATGEGPSTKEILWAMHGGKLGKFIKPRGVKDHKAIPISTGQTKDVRVEKLKSMALEYPYLFRFVDDTIGFKRLNFNIVRYQEARARHPDLAIPALDDLPVVFELEDKYPEKNEDMETLPHDHAWEPNDAGAGQTVEIVDLASLQAWRRRGRDRSVGAEAAKLTRRGSAREERAGTS